MGLSPTLWAAIGLIALGSACIIAALGLAWRRRRPAPGGRIDVVLDAPVVESPVAVMPAIDPEAVERRVRALERRVQELRESVAAEASRRARHADRHSADGEAKHLRRHAAAAAAGAKVAG